MTEKIIEIGEVKMEEGGWLTLPSEIAQNLGEKIVVSPSKNKLQIRSLIRAEEGVSPYEEFEKKLLEIAQNGDIEAKIRVRHIIGSAYEYTIGKTGRLKLEDCQREAICLSNGGEAVLFLEGETISLTSRKHWHDVKAEIDSESIPGD